MKEVAEVTDGVFLQGAPTVKVNGVCTDSRKINNGDLFVALQGQQVDGHVFAARALEQGAGALLVSRALENLPVQSPVVLVKDTLQALQQLARNNRDKLNIPVVAVTGSNGKTSTKDMIAAVLNTGYTTLKTEGNYNNELGLPLTLLHLNKEHRAAVVEMGMRGPGEIDFLARLAKPTAAVITNIGESHLEKLGSVRNIALAKGELLDHIKEEGFALVNGDSPYMEELAARCKGEVWFYSLKGPAHLVARNIRNENKGVRYRVTYPGGEGEIFLPVPGSHNVMNSLAALGVGLKLGLSFADIARGLEQVILSQMRLEVIETAGFTIINDAYNANPSSTKAALQVLEETGQGRRIAVLGNMYELGELAESGHRDVGKAAAKAGVRQLVAVGHLARFVAQGGLDAGLPEEQVHHCESNSQAIEMIQSMLRPGDTILIKGSRGMHMEEVVQALLSPEFTLGR